MKSVNKRVTDKDKTDDKESNLQSKNGTLLEEFKKDFSKLLMKMKSNQANLKDVSYFVNFGDTNDTPGRDQSSAISSNINSVSKHLSPSVITDHSQTFLIPTAKSKFMIKAQKRYTMNASSLSKFSNSYKNKRPTGKKSIDFYHIPESSKLLPGNISRNHRLGN